MEDGRGREIEGKGKGGREKEQEGRDKGVGGKK